MNPLQKRIPMIGQTVLFVLLAGALCVGCSNKHQSGKGKPKQDGDASALDMVNRALAATESFETLAAAELWSELRERFPDDPSVALNRALNAVLHVDQLTTTATSGETPEEKKAARSKLPAAISDARAAIEDYQGNSGDDVTQLWLATKVDGYEAKLLPDSMTKSLQRAYLKKLNDAIAGKMGDEPRSVILGGAIADVLEVLTSPIDGLPDQLLQPSANSIARLSDRHPDNLFLAMQSLRLSIDRQDPRAVGDTEKTWELARSVEPTIAAFTRPIGLTPEELKSKIITAVNASDWAQAQQSFAFWTNVVTPLEIMRTDRRRASPHPLDRLSFDTFRRLGGQLEQQNPIKGDSAEIEFDITMIGDDVDLVLPADADLDLDADLLSVSAKELSLWRNDAGEFTPFAKLSLDTKPTGILSADLFMVDSSDSDRLERTQGSEDAQDFSKKGRHDTLPGVVLFGEAGIQLVRLDTRDGTTPEQVLQVVEKDTGLGDVKNVAQIATGDLEGDGDLDLIVAEASGGLRVFVNRGNRTFFEVLVGAATVENDDPVVDMAIADLDRDLDLDVVTLHASGRVGLLENLLHLQFRLRYLEAVPPIKQPLSVAIEDIDGNVGWDVVVSGEDQSQIAFANSSDIGVWAVDRIETGKGFRALPLLGDFNNDSYFEWVDADQGSRLGPWGIDVFPGAPAGSLGDSNRHVVDLNGDGQLDMVSTREGKIHLAQNKQVSSHFVTVRFKGVADNAELSGRVNHFGIGSVLELRFGPHYRSRVVTGPATHFGLADIEAATSIRVIMPNGLTQTIRDPELDSIIEEDQTLKGSCPYLYSWDGEKFAFVTDCLWAAPLGLQVASGIVQKDRPWEYLKVDGHLVRADADGQYELRLTEELWEVAYVDKMELLAIDHPSDVDIWTNEKVGPPTIASPTVFAFGAENLHDVQSGKDTDGDDVTELLRQADERYVKGFDRRLRQGLCQPHWIDLDFGETARESLAKTPDASVYAVLRGWILPTDTSLNIQIDQNPELPPIEFPSVWVPDAKAEAGWRNVIPFMGFPGGKTKTIVVDVTGLILTEDPRLRVRTSAQIYWDFAQLAVVVDPVPTQTQVAELVSAEVAHHGFSAKSQSDSTRPEQYDYHDVDKAPKWPPLRGSVSRFGDCTERLREWDDAMVVISGGDEIRVRFNAPVEDPPPGWKRDFVLHCVGWDKDADLNTLTGQSIDPLPARQMTSYPPTIDSTSTFDAVRQINQSELRRRQSFRAFWYRTEPSHTPYLMGPDD
ncbi:MAG: FG-GAP-like repeat-containing protein [Planctomycetota bacterium]